MVSGWKAVRADERHGYAPRIVTHTPATDTQAAQEGSAAAGAEATEKKFTNAKDAKDAQKLAKQQRVDIAAVGPSSATRRTSARPSLCRSPTSTAPTTLRYPTLRSSSPTPPGWARTPRSTTTTPKAPSATRRRA